MHNEPTSTTKDTIIIVYFIPIDKNIAEYKVYIWSIYIKLDGMRDWSIFPNSFFKYNSDNHPGLNSVPASSTHYWTWFIQFVQFTMILLKVLSDNKKHKICIFKKSILEYNNIKRKFLAMPITFINIKTWY